MEPQKNNTRFGVIGCGYWGPNFVRIIRQSSSCQLTAICDIDSEKIKTLSQKFPEVQCSTNTGDVIDNPDIDAIIISTPVKSHFDLVRRALRADKHVLCEKPLVYTHDECRELERLAETAGKVLLVGHVFEYNPIIRHMKQMIADGKIGDVLYLDLTRTGLGPVRTDVNVIYDLASHDISILLALLEKMPLAITAIGSCFLRQGIEDVAFVTLEFPGSILASINVSWIDPIKQRQVKVVGSRKMLLFDDVSVSEKLKIIETGKDYQTDTGDFGSFQLSLKDGDIIIPNISYREPLLEEFEHFISCINGNEKPFTGAKRAGKVVKILEAIQYSLHNNGNQSAAAMKPHAISIVVPIYNEEDILQNAISANLRVVSRFTDDFELIVVNDGSTDRSKEIIDDSFGNDPNVVICHQPKNQGFGSAVRKGFELSHKQYLLCVPADSPLDEVVFSAFYNNIDKADVLVAYRRKRLGYSPRMKLNSWVFHWLVTILFRIKLKDYNWIHLYNRRIFDQGGINIESRGLFMLAEVLIKAKRAGFGFYEFPVDQQERLTGIATASKFSAIIRTLNEMFGFYFRL